jgi:hypothetical protein
MTMRPEWNKLFEFAWRILVFVVAIGIIIVVSTRWTRWEGHEGWQRTDDAYLHADVTAISAKVPGYVRELPIEDYQRVHKGQVLAQLVDDDYRRSCPHGRTGKYLRRPSLDNPNPSSADAQNPRWPSIAARLISHGMPVHLT